MTAYHFYKDNNKNNQIQPFFFEFGGEMMNPRIGEMQIGSFSMNFIILGVK